jgi:hypothetical protein
MWWCPVRCAWVRLVDGQIVIVETEHEIALRREPSPHLVGRWLRQAFERLAVR